jgi:hypothetical protein
VNDLPRSFPGATLSWRIVGKKSGEEVGVGELVQDVPSNSAEQVGRVGWTPEAPGDFKASLGLTWEGKEIAENRYHLSVRTE